MSTEPIRADLDEALRDPIARALAHEFGEYDPDAIENLMDAVRPEIERLKRGKALADQLLDGWVRRAEKAEAALAEMRGLFEAASELAGTRTNERDEARAALERLQANALNASEKYRDLEREATALRERNSALILLQEGAVRGHNAWQEEARKVNAERKRLTEQVKRVRALHSPIALPYDDGDVCGTCPDHLDYPCPTIRAMDGDATPSPGPAAAPPPGTAPTGTGEAERIRALNEAAEWQAACQAHERRGDRLAARVAQLEAELASSGTAPTGTGDGDE